MKRLFACVRVDPAGREAMQDTFAKYEQFAMGMDELQPLTRRGKNNFGGLGATVIDSLDTLWIMAGRCKL